MPVITEGGGHLGFHCASTEQPWCDLALEKFLDRIC